MDVLRAMEAWEHLKGYEGFDKGGGFKVFYPDRKKKKLPFRVKGNPTQSLSFVLPSRCLKCGPENEKWDAYCEGCRQPRLSPFHALLAQAFVIYNVEAHGAEKTAEELFVRVTQRQLEAAYAALSSLLYSAERDGLKQVENCLKKMLADLEDKVAPGMRAIAWPALQKYVKEWNREQMGYSVSRKAKNRLVVRLDDAIKTYTNLTPKNRYDHIARLLRHFALKTTSEGVRKFLLTRSKETQRQLKKEQEELRERVRMIAAGKMGMIAAGKMGGTKHKE